MYYRHFGLDGPPFRFSASTSVPYLGNGHRECLAALEWALLHDQCGFMLLVGETGTGKTTLLNIILARRLPKLQLACVPNPRLSFQEIMRVVLPQLGVVTSERGKLELIQALERAVANRPQGHRTAILIDEAQNLSDETLEDLRLLTNCSGAQDRELQIVLMGHPELLDRLSAHHLRQLRERISTKVSLPALNAAESLAYIDSRLQAQNGSIRVFQADAIRYLVEAATGIPRRLNTLCHNALLLAYAKNQQTVKLDVAREVVGDYEGIFLRSKDSPRPPLLSVKRAVSVKPSTVDPAAGESVNSAELAIRPRPRFALVAATAAAFVVMALTSVLIAMTTNLPAEFTRTAQKIASAAPSASPQVSRDSLADDKTLAARPGYTASIASASAPTIPSHLKEPAAAPQRRSIRIHAGDTFRDLAARYLGSKDRAWDLIKANPQIGNPSSLYVGEIVYLPSTYGNQQARVTR